MEKKTLKFDLVKAALYKCTSINQVVNIVNENSKVSDKSIALRVAGNILMKHNKEFPNQKIFTIEMNLRKQIDQLETKHISNLVHFVRVCRETKGLRKNHLIDVSEFNAIFKAFNEKCIESSEVIALFYDLKRIKAYPTEVDEFILKKLRNENFPMNISQIKIIMRTTLNNTTIYNQEIFEACIERILEIEFNLDLNNVVLELIEILFEANFKLIYYESSHIFEKIQRFLEETELSDNDYLRVLEAHRSFNKETKLLKTVIEKFIESFSMDSEPLIFGYILHICPTDLAKRSVFKKKFIPACEEIINTAKELNKSHIVILEGLMKYTKNDFSKKFKVDDFGFLFKSSNYFTKALILRYFTRFNIEWCDLSEFQFTDLNKENFLTLLKTYTILKNSDLFVRMPKLEVEFFNEMKNNLVLLSDSKRIFINFISEQYNINTKRSLETLISEFGILIKKYKSQELMGLRALFVLNAKTEQWENIINCYLNTLDSKNYIDPLTKNFVSMNTIDALIYLKNKSESKSPESLATYIFLLMHPNFWTMRKRK